MFQTYEHIAHGDGAFDRAITGTVPLIGNSPEAKRGRFIRGLPLLHIFGA